MLAVAEFADDVVRARPAFDVARLRVHERTGGQVVAERMAGDRFLFPAPVTLGLRRQACLDAVIVQQPVGLESMQVGAV